MEILQFIQLINSDNQSINVYYRGLSGRKYTVRHHIIDANNNAAVQKADYEYIDGISSATVNVQSKVMPVTETPGYVYDPTRTRSTLGTTTYTAPSDPMTTIRFPNISENELATKPFVIDLYYNPQAVRYKVEHYIPDSGEPTGYNLQYISEITAFASTIVTAKPIYNTTNTPLQGYYFDSENTNNVMGGRVEGDGTTVFKLHYLPNSSTSYSIQYYLQGIDGSYQIVPSQQEVKTGITNSTVWATINGAESMEPSDYRTFNGYTIDLNDGNISGVLVADGSLILRVRYTINKDTKYNVEVYKNSPSGPILESSLSYMKEGMVGESVTATPPAIEGYTYNPHFSTNTGFIKCDGTLVLKLYYDANDNTNYTIEYYLQNEDGSYPTVPNSYDTLIGKTGSTVGGTPKEILGYTYDKNAPGNVESVVIEGTGLSKLKYYYTADTVPYTIRYVTMNSDNSFTPIPGVLETTGTAIVGTLLNQTEVPPKDIAGYKLITPDTELFRVLATGNVFNYVYQPDETKTFAYRINYYRLVPSDATEAYKSILVPGIPVNPVEGSAVVGTEIPVDLPIVDGYKPATNQPSKLVVKNVVTDFDETNWTLAQKSSNNPVDNVVNIFYIVDLDDDYDYTLNYYIATIDGNTYTKTTELVPGIAPNPVTGSASAETKINISYPNLTTGYRALGIETSADTFTMPADFTLTAGVNNTANTKNIYYVKDDGQYKNYTIKHVAVDGVNARELGTETLKGLAGTTVYTSPKNFDGYIYTANGSTTSGLLEDDNLILTINYTESKKLTYIVKYVDELGVLIRDVKVVTEDVQVGTIREETAPAITGYTLVENEANLKTVMFSNGTPDNIFTFVYKKAQYAYTVKYLDENNEPVKDVSDKTGSAPFGSNVIETAIDITGYEVSGLNSKTLVVNEYETKNIIIFNYKKIANLPYTINYYKSDTLIEFNGEGNVDPLNPYVKAIPSPTADTNGYTVGHYVFGGERYPVIPADGFVITGEHNNVDVFYVRGSEDNINYKIIYTKDGDSNNPLDTVDASIHPDDQPLSLVNVTHMIPEFYRWDGNTSLPRVINEGYVITVNYIPDDGETYPYIVEYYVDGKLFDYIPYTISKLDPIVTLDDIPRANMPDGYKLEKYVFGNVDFTTGNVVVGETDKVIKVYYILDEAMVVNYEVKYYKGGVEQTDLIQNLTVPVGNPIINSVDTSNMPVGYKLDKMEMPLGTTLALLPITVMDGDIIHVYYVVDDNSTYAYNIEYYVEDKLFKNIVDTVNIASPEVEFDVIAPEGYTLDIDKTHIDIQDGTTTINSNGQILKIYFKVDEAARNYSYTVNYYVDGTTTNVPGITDNPLKGVGYINEVVTLNHPTALGYSLKVNFPDSIVVLEDNSSQINVYYVPDLKTVTYNPNTGTGADIVDNHSYNENVMVKANTSSKTGYAFIGWNTNADGSGTEYSPNQIIKLTDDLVLYAIWEAGDYTVEFDLNDGMGTIHETTVVAHGSTVTEPNVPQRNGFNFVGWYQDLNSDTSFDFSTEITSDIRLLAKWTPVDLGKTDIPTIVTPRANEVTVNGTAEPSSTVKVMIPQGTFITTADDLGNYRAAVKPLSEGDIVSVTATAPGKLESDKKEEVTVPGDSFGMVIVKYTDRSGVVISKTEYLTGTVRTDYLTVQKDISGYTYHETIGDSTGKFTKDNINVLYIYTATDENVMGTVVVKHVEKDTSIEISERVTISGNVGEDYATATKTILGYEGGTLQSGSSPSNGKFSEGITTVVYEYAKTVDTPTYKDGLVVTKHVDDDGVEISLRNESSGEIGNPYTTTAKTIAGYGVGSHDNTSAPVSGNYTAGTLIVVYKYEKTADVEPTIEGTVVVKHIDKATGGEIFGRDIITDEVSAPYNTTAKTITGYGTGSLQMGSAPAAGTISEGITTVVYEYSQLSSGTGSVVVKYVKEDNTPLIDEINLTGAVGSRYYTEEKIFQGYELIETPANATGTFETDEISVVYIYKSSAQASTLGSVMVYFEDMDGNPLGKKALVGEIGTEYIVTPSTIDNMTYSGPKAGSVLNGTFSDTQASVYLQYDYSTTQTRPNAPTINTVYEGENVISGIGTPGTTVVIFNSSNLEIGRAEVDDTGKYSISSADDFVAGEVLVGKTIDENTNLESLPIYSVVQHKGVSVNTAPRIEGVRNITISEGQNFNPLAGVTATDAEDLDLTNSITYIEYGVYKAGNTVLIKYSVTDSGGLTTEEIAEITIRENIVTPTNNKPMIYVYDSLIIKGMNFDPYASAKAYDVEDGDLTHMLSHSGSVNTQVPGVYELTYSVQDSDGNLTTKTIKVTVYYREVIRENPNTVYVQLPGLSVTTQSKENVTIKTEVHNAYIKGYEDNTFKPQGNLTRAEAAMIFARLAAPNSRIPTGYTVLYSDVKFGLWYSDAVAYASHLDLLKGYPDGSFNPNGTINRAELATIVTRFKNSSGSLSQISFTDVQSDYWAYDSIMRAARNGWVTGYPDGTFMPANAITRGEIVTMVNRMLGRNIIEKSMINSTNLINFNDITNHWAKLQIIEAANSHVTTFDKDDYEAWERISN